MSFRAIPPIQCLVTFETLARLRSATRTADELCVTVSAVSHRVRQLEAQLTEKHVSLDVDSDARRWLAEHGFDPQMGARPMARVIQEKVKRPLADELLFGKLADGGKVSLSVKDGELVVSTEAAEKLPAPVA